jgi:hypothetical protein
MYMQNKAYSILLFDIYPTAEAGKHYEKLIYDLARSAGLGCVELAESDGACRLIEHALSNKRKRTTQIAVELPPPPRAQEEHP